MGGGTEKDEDKTGRGRRQVEEIQRISNQRIYCHLGL